MKCSKVTRLLQAYLDNELSASQESQLEHHLKGCSLCRMQLDAYKKTNETMDLWTDREPHKDLVSPVLRILRHEKEAPSTLQRFLEVISANRRKILAVGANLIILLFIAVKAPLFFRQPSEPIRTKDFDIVPHIESTMSSNARATMPSYDPVNMAEYLNDSIDAHNLSPVERDMTVDNLMNDANDMYNGTLRFTNNSEGVGFRRVQVIYFRSSEGKSTTQRIIFTRQIKYEKTK